LFLSIYANMKKKLLLLDDDVGGGHSCA